MAGAAVMDNANRLAGAERHSPIHSHKPEAAFRAARVHSARVRILRIALPALGVLIAVSFSVYSWLMTSANTPFKVSEVGIVDGKLVMADPNLTGYTKDNRPYRIIARRAIQDFGNLERIELEEIQASLPVENDVLAQVKAESGVFDNKANSLTIDSPLTIVTDDGKKARLGDAQINIADGTLKTDKTVDIDTGGATISAQSLRVEDNGKVLVFDNKVRMTLVPDELKRRREANESGQD